MARQNWTRDELIVAFNLYCKIPFGQIDRKNLLVIQLAKAIGRTPSAVSWKLANFARLDPTLKKRNIAGAAHGAKSDIAIWREFNEDWDGLTFESERLLQKFTRKTPVIPDKFPEGKTREALIRTRVNQGFFRAAILAAYGTRCCITGLAIPEVLNASHIVPWAADEKNRTNPRNGLCLNALHDRAFDCGLITVTPTFKVKTSAKVRGNLTDEVVRELLGRYEDRPITLPSHFEPDKQFLKYHNEKVFLGS